MLIGRATFSRLFIYLYSNIQILLKPSEQNKEHVNCKDTNITPPTTSYIYSTS